MPADAPLSSPLRFAAVVLAAGPSRRLGRPKQLLAVDGRALSERAVLAALDGGAWPVVVVLGAHAAEVRRALARHPVLMVENAAWAEGMAASVRIGLETLNQFSRRVEGALFAVCDQPAFDAATVRALAAAWPRETGGVAAARYGGHLGVPVLFGRGHFPALAALTGEAGARQVLRDLPPDQVRAVDLPALAQDIDTPADWAAWTDDPPEP